MCWMKPSMPFKSLLHKMKFKKSQVINNLSKNSESPPEVGLAFPMEGIVDQEWWITTQSHPAAQRPSGDKKGTAHVLTLGGTWG